MFAGYAVNTMARSTGNMAEIPFLVLCDGYHGWGDEWVSMTPPARGVPPVYAQMRQLKNDFTDEQIAEADAVILEPVKTDWSDERRAWLQRLREACTKSGTILIFDEVVTGFRFPRFSVSSYWGITPDLIVLGKAIANGMPLAAVGGKYDVMNGSEYFVSSTYAGETLSLAAAKKTMELLQSKNDLDWLWKQGQAFLDEFNAVWPEMISIAGYPTRGAFVGDPLVKALFMQESCLAGILFGPSWFLNFPAAAEWRDAMGAIKAILGRIKRGEVQLKGDLPSSPFSQKVREA
jgi:4-aminobutyrate aminotransferase-like enzyme